MRCYNNICNGGNNMATKTVKIALEYMDKENVLKYNELSKELFDISYKTYVACNKAMTYLYSKDARDIIQADIGLPKISNKDLYGKSFNAYVENKMNEIMQGCLSTNVAQTRQFVCNRYSNDIKKGLLKGEISLTRFKRGMPIILHNKAYSISKTDKGILVEIGLFNLPKQKQLGVKRIKFLIRNLGGSDKTIFSRLLDNVYKKGTGQLSYNKKKKKWMLAIAYKFDDMTPKETTNIVMGIDLGINNTAVISILDDDKKKYIDLRYNDAFIDGSEIRQFREKHEARKRSEFRAAKWASANNIGRGRLARMERAYSDNDKCNKFRDTYNHKISRYIVNLAVKNNVSLIQMEDLKGISREEKNEKLLRNWSYYDLQNKISYKAKLSGISIHKVSPEFTSQRCSKCGYIDSNNRHKEKFYCLKCGSSMDADYNASKNIAIPNIEEIIKEYKKEEKSSLKK